MQLGISIELGTGRRRGSGAGAVPVISGVSFPGNDLQYSVVSVLPATHYSVSTSSATPPSAASIVSTPDDTVVLAVGPNNLPPLTLQTTPGTWYLHFLCANVYGNSTVNTVSYVIAAAGFTFTETWSAFTVGDTTTQIDAGGYTFSSTNVPVCTIVTDAGGTSAKAINGTGANASARFVRRDDIATQLGTPYTTLEVLVEFRTSGASPAKGGVGLYTSTTLVHGLHFNRNAGGFDAGFSRDVSFGSSVQQLHLTGGADNLIYWARFQFSGGNLRGRIWADGASEPGSYGADLAVVASTVGLPLALITREATATNFKILGYSVGIDTGAPSF